METEIKIRVFIACMDGYHAIGYRTAEAKRKTDQERERWPQALGWRDLREWTMLCVVKSELDTRRTGGSFHLLARIIREKKRRRKDEDMAVAGVAELGRSKGSEDTKSKQQRGGP